MNNASLPLKRPIRAGNADGQAFLTISESQGKKRKKKEVIRHTNRIDENETEKVEKWRGW